MIPTRWVRLSWGRREGTSIFGRENSVWEDPGEREPGAFAELKGSIVQGTLWGSSWRGWWLGGATSSRVSRQVKGGILSSAHRGAIKGFTEGWTPCGGGVRRRQAWPPGTQKQGFTYPGKVGQRRVGQACGLGVEERQINEQAWQSVREFGRQGSIYFTAVGKCGIFRFLSWDVTWSDHGVRTVWTKRAKAIWIFWTSQWEKRTWWQKTYQEDRTPSSWWVTIRNDRGWNVGWEDLWLSYCVQGCDFEGITAGGDRRFGESIIHWCLDVLSLWGISECVFSGSGRPPGEGHGNPLQYSCLENPMDRGAWRAAVHGVAKESDMSEWPTL